MISTQLPSKTKSTSTSTSYTAIGRRHGARRLPAPSARVAHCTRHPRGLLRQQRRHIMQELGAKATTSHHLQPMKSQQQQPGTPPLGAAMARAESLRHARVSPIARGTRAAFYADSAATSCKNWVPKSPLATTSSP